MCLLAIDAEKAFDRVQWPFLHHVLTKWGLDPTMLHRIQALCMTPSARLRLNELLSSSFPISNGTHQSCPLSPLLYILVMEHLAVALRTNLNIVGPTVGPYSPKISLFANDLLLSFTDPLQSLLAAIANLKAK